MASRPARSSNPRHTGLTQAELAARAGTSRTRLSAYEHAHTEPGLEVLMRSTAAADLDGVFEPELVIYEAAARVGARRGLNDGWLNDAVKGFLPGPDPNATVFFDRPGLVVRIASARYLLGMKLLASRVERDEDDIGVLLRVQHRRTDRSVGAGGRSLPAFGDSGGG